MARAISDRTNVDAPSGNFTRGRVRNNDGSGNGTPNNEALHGDWTQFFEKLMRDNGITPNGNPDDQVNNQIYQGLLSAIDGRFAGTTSILTQGAFDALTSTITGVSDQYFLEINTKTVVIDTDPISIREIGGFLSNIPIGERITVVTPSTFLMVLNTTGSAFPIRLSGNTTPDDSYIPPEVFTLVRFATWWQLIEH
jgi:hypothetical protein